MCVWGGGGGGGGWGAVVTFMYEYECTKVQNPQCHICTNSDL